MEPEENKVVTTKSTSKLSIKGSNATANTSNLVFTSSNTSLKPNLLIGNYSSNQPMNSVRNLTNTNAGSSRPLYISNTNSSNPLIGNTTKITMGLGKNNMSVAHINTSKK